MRLEVLAVGRLKTGPESELYDRFCERIVKSGKQLHLTGPHLTEIPEGKGSNVALRKQEESRQLLAKVEAGSKIILLDERGKDLTSQGFAELIRAQQEDGVRSLAFAIGGADGHGDDLKAQADRSIRFGSMTWPHQLVRIMLVEQIYRAITILSGHPYHRE
ncbi:MAG: 23S rRNA (pseudouridine(1915)-N(3))-methyltransferase RlmH [Pseudomonadota bacterium]